MDNYLNSFREMISLRGLTDHTLKITAPISGLIWIIFPPAFTNFRKMFPGRNSVIISDGFKIPEIFLTVP